LAENIVGKGGYAKVFKGILPCGRLIAVKKHNRGDASAEKEHDFLIELGIISHVSHPNTATLLGICIENGLHLVFQFSQHGSLQGLLHNPTRGLVLDWGVRYKVAVGVAHGLHYLHESCQRRIIHRDIKASNILLGPDFEPQISDFGLAKWLPDRWTHHTVSPVEGTIGYFTWSSAQLVCNT
jgi:serine/threonine protein kinase